MRGRAARETETICLINVESQLRSDHPLREVKRMCREVLKALEPDFERMYAAKGRPNIPPERLWRVRKTGIVIACQQLTTA